MSTFTDLIPVIALGLLLFIATVVVIIARGQMKRSTSEPNTKKKFKKNYLDNDNAEDYRAQHSKENTARNLFSAVSIAHDMHGACEDVQALGNVRFLSKEAPMIPLKNCSRKQQCDCRYVHHKDRRRGQRRNSFMTIASDARNEERRAEAQRGRRFTDK